MEAVKDKCGLRMEINHIHTSDISGEEVDGIIKWRLDRIDITFTCTRCRMRELREIHSGRTIAKNETYQSVGMLVRNELDDGTTELSHALRVARMDVILKYCRLKPL